MSEETPRKGLIVLNKGFDNLSKLFAIIAACILAIDWIIEWKQVDVGVFHEVIMYTKNSSIYATLVFTILEAFTEESSSHIIRFLIFMLALLSMVVIFV